MTRKAFITDKMTKFSLWIRENCTDSKQGLVLSNIDYFFYHYKKKRIKIIEEKTHGVFSLTNFSQQEIFRILDNALKLVEEVKYEGIFIVTFTKESPDDGNTFITKDKERKKVTAEQLREFINFNILWEDL